MKIKAYGLLGLFLLPAMVLTLPPAAQAVILTPSSAVSTTSSQDAYDTFISATDLLTGLTPTTTAGPDGGFPLNGINDGAAQSNPPDFATSNDTWFAHTQFFPGQHSLDSDPVVTFTFDTSVNTLGYNITSLQSIYGWADNNSFADQDFTIMYTLVSTPGTFTLGSVAFNPFDPASDLSGSGPEEASKVELSDLGLTGVSSISFEFTPYTSPSTEEQAGVEQAGQLIREIDVFGEATPEPSTWAMIGAGALLLVWRLRRSGGKFQV